MKMPYKETTLDEMLLAPRYKWEFIRRNKKYQSDCKKYFKKGYMFSRKVGEHLYKNYGMGYPIHPKFSFIEHLRRVVEYHGKSPFYSEKLRALSYIASIRQIFPYDFPAFCLDPLKLRLELYDSSRPCPYEPSDYTVNVKINLAKPHNEIMQELEYIIKGGRKFYKITEPEQEDMRNPWGLYDEYLKIWDMKHKQGKFLGQIIFELDDHKTQGHADRIRKMLPAAEKMVDGGFRKIGNIPIFRINSK